MSGSLTSPDDAFFGSIREILAEARRKAATSVNVIMVEAYWRIGARIVEQEQKGEARAAYGKELIKELSRRLGDEFGRGFSIANLKNFRQFYLTFPDSAKGYALRSELGWTHYRLIMRVEEPKARAYYLEAAAGQGWTSRQLERNIRSGWHQRLLEAPEAESGAAPLSPENIFKDPYILEFLNLPEDTKTHERDLESALIDNLQAFLLELGRGFSFVGRQFRISSETSHFYIDLVFYHYLLKCFVLIDLKIDKLAHQDIGQMDMYVRMFDDLKRGEDDNPTLGIILCADKDQTIVRYSVLHGNEQLFAAKYLTILPSEAELARELEARHVLDIPTEGGEA
ncbi:MAG: PDDEXK nuclease domain-containing protein [Akkermansiaceae bacterium]|nr:PDDEXK nuclease domain-containing protein [Akkermansiaceae bacterium]